jgi:extracellular factor (EF) 3-hydroxypalmitic acid methyl ester biosynthesis protein
MDQVLKDSLVVGRSSQGFELRAVLLRLAPHLVVFEVPGCDLVLQTSEVLTEFQIIVRERTLYSGRAVIKAVVDTGLVLVCEAVLEDSWLDVASYAAGRGPAWLQVEFNTFVKQWQKYYRVLPEYKVVVADLQTFLSDLRLWLEQMTMGIGTPTPAQRLEVENEIALGLRSHVTSALSNIFERFEAVSGKVDEDLVSTHRAFAQRQLHPLLLCGPFIRRCFVKPLGYAGDYEMMNMIVRNGMEGTSLYARLVNAYMLDQAPARAVRNRVGYLTERIFEETARVSRLGRIANIYNVACGPALEVENFIAEQALSDRAQVRLLDFNEETLNFAAGRINEAKRRYGRMTEVELVKNSVHSLLKAQGKTGPGERRYDLIYSSGLYDYLGDRVCRALNSYLYEQLSPGGLLVIGNFNTSNPIQWQMAHALEWFLIYRDTRQMTSLVPNQVPSGNFTIRAESTGTNIFLEMRKPE